MLDLANVTEPGRATFTTYLRSWERFAGRPADPRLTRIGCLSATDYIDTFYMAFALNRDFIGIEALARSSVGVWEVSSWSQCASKIDRVESALRDRGGALESSHPWVRQPRKATGGQSWAESALVGVLDRSLPCDRKRRQAFVGLWADGPQAG